MELTFFKTTQGKDAVKVNGSPMHSLYNPELEAQRFVESIAVPFKPAAIIITGPCLSYSADFLRKKFPYAKLIAVQFSSAFSKYDFLWDKVFLSEEKNLSEKIFDFLGDEILMSTFFISWKASERVFFDEYKRVWQELKNLLLKSRNLLNTKSHFSKKWFVNTIRFSLFSKTYAYYKKADCPLVICASGPSLSSSIDFLKKYRDKYFLIALSSSLKVLTQNKIIPDFCLSTDGGFWAKKHLYSSLTKYPQIPLALPGEAACPGLLLENNIIFPLAYDDAFEKYFYPPLGIKAFSAQSNGSVSGTAAILSLSLTDDKIFFCGLDLSSSIAFQHSQPNELEEFDSTFDFALSTKENRIVSRMINSQALDIYHSWFNAEKFGGKIFRLSNNYNYKNTLSDIKDVNFDYFKNHISKSKCIKCPLEITENREPLLRRIEIVKSILQENKNNSEWIKKLFPVEGLLLKRALNQDEKIKMQKDLNEKIKSFFENIYSKLQKSAESLK